MTVRNRWLVFPLTEPDMEQTGRSGAVRSWSQIIRDLQGLEVSNLLYRWEEMFPQKKAGGSPFPWSGRIQEIWRKLLILSKNWDFAQSRKQKCWWPWLRESSMQWLPPVLDGFLTESVRSWESEGRLLLKGKLPRRWSLLRKRGERRRYRRKMWILFLEKEQI